MWSKASKREGSEGGGRSCRRYTQDSACVWSCWRWVSQFLERNFDGGSDQDGNSYQNAIGSARKVVQLVKGLELEASK